MPFGIETLASMGKSMFSCDEEYSIFKSDFSFCSAFFLDRIMDALVFPVPCLRASVKSLRRLNIGEIMNIPLMPSLKPTPQ